MSAIRQVFVLSLYLLACLGATMLALAETGVPLGSLITMARLGAVASIFPGLLTLPIAFAAYRIVEKRRWSISPRVAGGLGVAALVVALLELWLRDIEGRLLFAAHLLVYLTWILLWQEKQPRQRWGLVALAILQVAVGSVLTTAGWFGLSLAVFMGLSIWTLVLLQIAAAEEHHAAGAEPRGPSEAAGTRSLLAHGRVTPLGHATVSVRPKRPLAASVVLTTIGSLAIGAAFFLFVPRIQFGMTAFEPVNEPLGRRRVTGFTDRVRLGSMGQILESSAPAFDVRITGADGEPLAVKKYASRLGMEEPLFRGLTLSEYEDGQWYAEEGGVPTTLRPTGGDDTVKQVYHLRMSDPPVLFALAPVYAGHVESSDRPIRHWTNTEVLRARDIDGNGGRYTVYSPPERGDAPPFRRRRPWNRNLAEYTAFPDGLDRLAATAQVAIGDNADTESEKAERLLTFLRDSGQFRYSLSGEIVNPRLDPIEDFLLNRKSGHCEYFAAALALMLRAEGIPSRVVNGYKGGEPNPLTGRFEVQQRHAHSWVEAHLGGRWKTLDPSPSSERESVVKSSATPVPFWSKLTSSSSLVWRDYVVQLNISRQREALSPLKHTAVVLYTRARDEWWPAFKSHAYAFATNPDRWFSWQGGLVTFIGLLIVVGFWRLSRRLTRRLRRGGPGDEQARHRAPLVDFYEEFRRLCRQRGWRQEPTQTPREFSDQVAESLGTMRLAPEFVGLPEELTGDYYRIRFGDLELGDDRRQMLTDRLSALRTTLAQGEMGDRDDANGYPTKRTDKNSK